MVSVFHSGGQIAYFINNGERKREKTYQQLLVDTLPGRGIDVEWSCSLVPYGKVSREIGRER